MNVPLRKALGELAALDAREQLIQLETLRQEFGHSIIALTDPTSNLVYNCVMYALGLQDHAELYQLLVHLTFGSDKDLGITMDTSFLQMLINSGDLQESAEVASCLVVYSSPEKITHIGSCISPGRVASKWGTAHLYEHDFLDSPLEYASGIQFYAPIDKEFAVDQFFEYARAKGAKLD
jgi:hypothetical protein